MTTKGKRIITSELQNGKWYGEIKNLQDLSPTCPAESIKNQNLGEDHLHGIVLKKRPNHSWT